MTLRPFSRSLDIWLLAHRWNRSVVSLICRKWANVVFDTKGESGLLPFRLFGALACCRQYCSQQPFVPPPGGLLCSDRQCSGCKPQCRTTRKPLLVPQRDGYWVALVLR